METVETNELAMMMQQNCTLKRSDIVAVISELVDTMTREMQNGKRIRLDGLGTFKIGLTSEGVSDPKDFRPERHVKGTHVLFYPETHVMRDGQRLRALLTGTKARELRVEKR
jgi:predicted histone-like DNA-binding protein